MRTITMNVYSFGELSDEAKEKAIDAMRYAEVQHEWWEYVYYAAEMVGVNINEFDIDRASHCSIDFQQSPEFTAYEIVANHGKTCDTYGDAEAFIAGGELYPILFKQNLSESYLAMLRREYEYLTSDKAVIEMIEANEYEFTEGGTIHL